MKPNILLKIIYKIWMKTPEALKYNVMTTTKSISAQAEWLLEHVNANIWPIKNTTEMKN